ncbi:MAG: YggS family pyridoxal phosphate-dependent enzyme [Oscillospiraceae bacterium]|nr:YggS family pyridoxal phosphate-dependent enzyme [Clostridiaceae bacterium]MDO4495041.1 YggS family pyridoxal phosphate-dependent enzyme [Clostridiaceae bacterium]MDY5949204.1 YggS family pyridoxal phosphate-dependent enzyme [Oscillospiraceae bacterium]
MEWLSDEERFSAIDENLKYIAEEIAEAALKSGRKSEDISLMAVTKTVESKFINYAVDKGIGLIGENKVQEFLMKEPELNLSKCKAHLIGHLQSNKVKKIVGKVDTIQSVDSVAIAREIGKRSVEAGVNTKILLEVNVGNEESKFGFSPDEVFERACEISEINGILIDGLMCVAPICEKDAEIRRIFSNMRRLFIDIEGKKRDNINMNVLSMGMSGDYKNAILEGANLVRIGSAIFGSRIYR